MQLYCYSIKTKYKRGFNGDLEVKRGGADYIHSSYSDDLLDYWLELFCYPPLMVQKAVSAIDTVWGSNCIWLYFLYYLLLYIFYIICHNNLLYCYKCGFNGADFKS